MLESSLSLLAQITPSGVPVPGPTSAPAADMPWFAKLLQQGGMLIPLSLILIVFYIVVFRQKKKQDKEKKNLLDNVKKGDTIETIGGLLGTVVSADDKTVTLKVDETANVKMKFNRRAIHRVIVEEKA